MEKKPTLKEWLKITCQTYKVFAEKLGMKQQAIERIANNKDKISWKQARRIWIATNYEVRLISLYPELPETMATVSHVKKEDLLCESIGDKTGKYPDSIV
jgi:hypothetical protein